MSYTGFIAGTDLYEVAKDGDSSKGSWVVPVERSESIERRHFVMADERAHGGAGAGSPREREPSSSDSPGVNVSSQPPITRRRCSPGSSCLKLLEEFLGKKLDEDPADEIFKLTVCEPALGSGAFAIEAVRQLADEYLKLKQAELGADSGRGLRLSTAKGEGLDSPSPGVRRGS